MKKILLALALFSLTIVGCTDDNRSREVLRKAGFTEIQITGYSYFACGEGDDFHTGFRAKNPQGEIVEGTVCCGMMKSCTIRF